MSESSDASTIWLEIKSKLKVPEGDAANAKGWLDAKWKLSLQELPDFESPDAKAELDRSSSKIAASFQNVLTDKSSTEEEYKELCKKYFEALTQAAHPPPAIETEVAERMEVDERSVRSTVSFQVVHYTLETMNVEIRVDGEPAPIEFAFVHCLEPGKLPSSSISYIYTRFLDQAQLHANDSRETPLDLAHSTLSYIHGRASKIVTRQSQFEIAVNFLYNKDKTSDGEGVLLFDLKLETEVEKRNRRNVEAAKNRLKQTPTSKPLAGAKRELSNPQAFQPTATRQRGTTGQTSKTPATDRPSDQTSNDKPKTGTPSTVKPPAKAAPKFDDRASPPRTKPSAIQAKVPPKTQTPLKGKRSSPPPASRSSTTKAQTPTTNAVVSKPGSKVVDLFKRTVSTSRASTSTKAVKSPTSPRAERKESEVTVPPLTPTFTPQAQNFAVPRPNTATKVRESIGSVIGSIKNTLQTSKDVSEEPSVKLSDSERRSQRYSTMRIITSRKTYTKGGDTFDPKSMQDEETADEEDNNEDEEQEEEEEQDQTDFSLRQLQNLQNMDELTQMATADDPVKRWQECCRLFRIDFKKTGINERVKVAGLRNPLYQYQAFGVYWQIMSSRINGGGFVADEMGLGKTLSFLAFIVVERQLSVLWREVRVSRAANDGKHLQEDAQHSNDFCPSQKENWIACPCASSSPASKWHEKPGLRLACVPPSLVSNWKDEFLRQIVHVEELNMRLLIAHNATSTKDEFDISDHTYIVEAARIKNALKGKFDPNTAKLDQDRILIVTTSESTNPEGIKWKWPRKFMHKAEMRVYDKSEGGRWVTIDAPALVYGIAMIDECHEHFHKEKGRSKTLADLPQENHPWLWGYSGTPFTQTPRGLEGVLWAIERHWPKNPRYDPKHTGWQQAQQDGKLGRFAYSNLDEICKAFEKHVKQTEPDKANLDAIFRDFKPYLINFMIRRTAETSWFGHPLLKLKPHEHADITLQHNDNFDDELSLLREVIEKELQDTLKEQQATWDKAPRNKKPSPERPTKLSYNAACRVQWRLRIMATFPYLVKFAANESKDHLTFTSKECFKIKKSVGGIASSPYGKHFRAICESSPKCIELYNLIENLFAGKDYLGRENKMVIISEFNPAVFLLQIFITKMVDGMKDRVGTVTADMRPNERNATIEAFTDATDGDGKRKQKKDFAILIGTTRLIGTGLQLTRASTVVMMEPQYEFFRELQAYARVHRIGQNNPKSYSVRLIDGGSEVETTILKRQADRNEFAGKAATGDEVEGLEQMDTRAPTQDLSMPDITETGEDEMSKLSDELSDVNIGTKEWKAPGPVQKWPGYGSVEELYDEA